MDQHSDQPALSDFQKIFIANSQQSFLDQLRPQLGAIAGEQQIQDDFRQLFNKGSQGQNEAIGTSSCGCGDGCSCAGMTCQCSGSEQSQPLSFGNDSLDDFFGSSMSGMP